MAPDAPQPFAEFQIQTKAGERVPLVPNRQQLQVLAAIGIQQAAGVPVRLLILKYRQGGFSTIAEAVMFREVHGKPNRHALVAAHDDDSSERLFRMNKLFEEAMPAEMRRPTEYSSKREIVWGAAHLSSFEVQTAGKVNLGRSKTLQYLHASEVAFWRNAEQSLLSVLNAVPDLPDTMVVLESTANGVGGEFYDRWQAAVKARRENPQDVSGFLPLFFSWLDYPEYRRAVPEGYVWGELDELETGLVRLGADLEQLYWRRCMIAEKCGGDPSQFQQEYPSTPEEAFQGSGRPAIPAAIIRRHRQTIERPRRARFTWDTNCESGVRIEIGEFSGPDVWSIWRTAEEFHDYTAAGDVAEGSLADGSNPRSEPDWSVGAVLDRVDLGTVAQLITRMDADLFGEELLKASTYYNRAWASPETNPSGVAATLVFKRHAYARIYRRMGADERVVVENQDLLGWKTTTGNRDGLIDDYIAGCRADPVEGYSDCFLCRSVELVEQEETFVRNKVGKRVHRDGCHDDVLFAWMIAWQLHLRCPRTRRIESIPNRAIVRDYRWSDGVDPGVEGPAFQPAEAMR